MPEGPEAPSNGLLPCQRIRKSRRSQPGTYRITVGEDAPVEAASDILVTMD